MGALAATIQYAPESASGEDTLFGHAYASFRALGVGAAGGRAAAAGCLMGFGARAAWAACDTDPSRLLSTGLPRKIHLELPDGYTHQALIRRALERRAEELDAILLHARHVVLLADSGESDAASVLPVLIGRIVEAGRFVCVVEWRAAGATAPAPVADPRVTEDPPPPRASLGLTLAASEAPAASASGVVEPPGRAAEVALLAAAQALLAVWSDSVPERGLKPEQMVRLALGAERVTVCTGVAAGPDAPAGAARQALARARGYLAERWVAVRPVLALAAGREFAARELEQVSALLKAELTGEAVPPSLALGHEPSLGDEARGLLLALPAPNPNVLHMR